jgi:hypothetical protein
MSNRDRVVTVGGTFTAILRFVGKIFYYAEDGLDLVGRDGLGVARDLVQTAHDKSTNFRKTSNIRDQAEHRLKLISLYQDYPEIAPEGWKQKLGVSDTKTKKSSQNINPDDIV